MRWWAEEESGPEVVLRGDLVEARSQRLGPRDRSWLGELEVELE